MLEISDACFFLERDTFTKGVPTQEKVIHDFLFAEIGGARFLSDAFGRE